jgi:hypothetical protein
MDKMPEQKDGYVTLWRGGNWVQVPLEDMPKIMEEDNRGITEETELPAGA